MRKRGKKYLQATKLVESTKLYSVEEAVELLERTNTVKFDPTVEIHFNLNIDSKLSDQLVRGTISLPHGSGKSVRVAAFTEGHEKELKALGVNIVGGEDLIESVAQGKIEFDIAIATPSMMRKMGKIAKVLGPKGLMPSPKSGTVSDDVIAVAKELLAGKFEYKNDKLGSIHSIVGKLSFGSKKLADNIAYFLQTMKDARPKGLKSWVIFIKSAYLANTMGPGIRLEIK